MIKIRIDWHQYCPSCETELVVDLLALGAASANCPWCGATVPGPLEIGHEAIHRELIEAVRRLEDDFTRKLNVSGATD